jgi:hypothetical protein
MTENAPVNQQQVTENKPSDKEFNFRKVEAKNRELEQRWEQEKQARLDLEKQINELKSSRHQSDDDEDDEPYIAPKRLEKKLANLGQKTSSEIQRSMEAAKQSAKEELKQELWLENNTDFEQTLNEDNLTKLLTKHPAMADSIRRMPDGFEKQRLVYNTIKSMGIDKPEPKQQSVQDKIDANRRSPYYQQSGVGSAPYAMAGDFSPVGQKNAHAKMKELQARLRM